MSRIRNVVLIVALVAVLGAAFGFHAAAVKAAPAAPAASIAQSSMPAIAFPVSRPGYVSEDELWREFCHAADRHAARIAKQLLRIINMRHKHRVGLPR